MSFSVGVGNMEEGETNFDVITNAISLEIDKPYVHADKQYAKWDVQSWGYILMKSSIEEIAI